MALPHPSGEEKTAGISCLPPDVLTLIARCLEHTHDGSARELRSFMSVCKEWYTVGRSAASRILIDLEASYWTNTRAQADTRLERLLKLFPNAEGVTFRAREDLSLSWRAWSALVLALVLALGMAGTGLAFERA